MKKVLTRYRLSKSPRFKRTIFNMTFFKQLLYRYEDSKSLILLNNNLIITELSIIITIDSIISHTLDNSDNKNKYCFRYEQNRRIIF